MNKNNNNTNGKMEDKMNRLQNHRGRFLSILVNRVKGGQTAYCAKIQRITPKTLKFMDVHTKTSVTVPIANIVEVA